MVSEKPSVRPAALNGSTHSFVRPRVTHRFHAFLAVACNVVATEFLLADDPVTLTRLGDRVRVEIGGSLFTEYVFGMALRGRIAIRFWRRTVRR
jgi:hypothetical protein